MKKIILILIFICNSQFSFSNDVELVGKKGYKFVYDLNYYSSSGFYDSNSEFNELNDNQSFSLFDNKFSAHYGAGNRLELRGGINYRQVQAQDSRGEASVSGIESYLVGAKFTMPVMIDTQYTFDFYLSKTTFTNSLYSSLSQTPAEDLTLGDDGSELGIGLLVKYNKIIFGQIYYVSPKGDVSAEVSYKAELRKKWDSFGLFGGLNGVYSLGGDSYSDNPTSKPFIESKSTLLFNSIDRQVIKVHGGIFSSLNNNWDVELNAQQTLSGTYADRATELGLKITYKKSNVMDSDLKRINTFKEYIAEAYITQVSPRQKFVRINKGLDNDFEKGMRVDIYDADFYGKNILVAKGFVFEVKSNFAIIKVVRKFKEYNIKNGNVVRGY